MPRLPALAAWLWKSCTLWAAHRNKMGAELSGIAPYMTHLKNFVVVSALVRLIAEEVNLLVARFLDKLEAVRLVPPDWKYIKGYLAACEEQRHHAQDVMRWLLYIHINIVYWD